MRFSCFCTCVVDLSRPVSVGLSPMHMRPSRAMLCACLLVSAITGQSFAQTGSSGVGFEGSQAVVAVGLGIPHAVATDAAGNLYVADLIDSKVLKVPRKAVGLDCSVSGSCATLGSGFVKPTGAAVDSSGNVFITDASTQSLYKITASGTQTTIASGLASPSGVAIASDGSAFIAVSNAVVRVTAAGVVSTFAAGPAQPGGIALDAAGDLYVADVGGNRVLKFAGGAQQTTFASGLDAPQSVALDGGGTLYVTDTRSNRVLSLPAAGAGHVCPADCTVLAVQTSGPSGVSSDASGNLYIADTGHNQVVKLTQDADFGTFPVSASNGRPANSLTLSYRLYSSSCASPPTVRVVARGAAGKDFTIDPSTSVCTPATPDSLALTINFTPLSPGLRTGSVQFTDATGGTQVRTYLHGVGKGPETTWTPGVVTNAIATPVNP